MKKKTLIIACILTVISVIAGCGKDAEETASYPTPDDFEPIYYLSEEEIPTDTYCIVHQEEIENKDGEKETIIRYYPLHKAERTYEDVYSYAAGEEPKRVFWVNYNIDEGLIPTMYPGDKLIYKSNTYIPTVYSLEKFFDNGYTFGVCGLKADLSGNYRFDIEDGGYTLSTSDAVGFENLEADTIYFVSANDIFLKNGNVSSSGTVTGVELMNTYACDIRTGTEKIAADLLVNVHYFSSAECYLFGDFTFITEHIAQINIPDYVTTGYYDVNGAGYFRYLKTEDSYKELSAEAYNETIYVYDEYDKLIGSKDGKVFDENYFLVENTEDLNENGEYDYVPDYIDLEPVEAKNTSDKRNEEDASNENLTNMIQDETVSTEETSTENNIE